MRKTVSLKARTRIRDNGMVCVRWSRDPRDDQSRRLICFSSYAVCDVSRRGSPVVLDLQPEADVGDEDVRVISHVDTWS